MIARLFLVTIVCAIGGCIESGLLPPDGDGPTDETFPRGDVSDGVQPDEGAPIGRLAVSLSVSNTSPQVYEELVLTCTLADGDVVGVAFAFQSNVARLTVDSARGRATFVVDASDINTELTFTCTATNDSGASAPSNRVVVIPTG